VSLDLDALRAKLAEYDPSAPRCSKKVAEHRNYAPDGMTSDDPAWGDYTVTLFAPCCRPAGHEDECRNSRRVMGWPGHNALSDLLDEVERLRAEVERLRAHRESCHANLLKGYDTGKVEERKLIAAWLWQQSVATHDYEGDEQTVSEVYASAARAIEQGASREETK
jgi:hypothetical protein